MKRNYGLSMPPQVDDYLRSCIPPYYSMYIHSALRIGRGKEPAEPVEARRDLIELATLVFEDERCLVYTDRIEDQTGEQRWIALGMAQAAADAGILLVVAHVYRRMNMAKRSSASSPRGRRKNVTSEDMRRRRWTKSELDAARRIAARQAAGDDSGINYEDIPRLTDEQLAKMVRLRDVRPKVPVSVRLDPRVLEWLKSKGEGHLTRINDILINLMEAERRAESR